MTAMKHLIFLTCTFFLFKSYVKAQTATPPRVHIISNADTLPPASTGNSKHKIIKLKFQLTGSYDTANDLNNRISLSMQRGSLTNTPAFVKTDGTLAVVDTITILKEDWPTTGKPEEITMPVQISLQGGTEITGDEIGQIIVTGYSSGNHAIVLSNDAVPLSTKYNPNKPFWVEIGSNFDFIDGVQPNNPFFGVFFHKRDVKSFNKDAEILENQAQKNIGVFAGVYESKTVSTNQTEDFFSRSYFNNTSFIPGKPDSIKFFKDAGKYAVKKSVRNIGLFFSPQMRISQGSANIDGLHIFVSFWAELQWQQITQENDYTQLIRIDSSLVGINQISALSKTNSGIANNQKSVIDIRSHYFGFGLPVFYREKDAHLFINPIIGISNQANTEYLRQIQKYNPDAPDIKRKWESFYAIQFRLNEEKYGISFTGEVRGLLQKNNPPFVSLALSKKFDLTRFLEFK
jgi:hypothetical protein